MARAFDLVGRTYNVGAPLFAHFANSGYHGPRQTLNMTKLERWFRQLDKFKSLLFMPDGRHQPQTPKRAIFESAEDLSKREKPLQTRRPLR